MKKLGYIPEDTELLDILLDMAIEEELPMSQEKTEVPSTNNSTIPFNSDGTINMDVWNILLQANKTNENIDTEELFSKITSIEKNNEIVCVEPEVKNSISEEEIYDRLMSIFKKPKQTSLLTDAIKKQVLAIWNDCVVKTPMPWKDKSNIIGETLNNDYCYYYDKLVSHSDEIEKLLLLVNYATRFDDLRTLNNGEEWTKFRQHAGFLMSLGNALGYIKFKNERQNWNTKEEHNPEIAFSLVRK